MYVSREFSFRGHYHFGIIASCKPHDITAAAQVADDGVFFSLVVHVRKVRLVLLNLYLVSAVADG